MRYFHILDRKNSFNINNCLMSVRLDIVSLFFNTHNYSLKQNNKYQSIKKKPFWPDNLRLSAIYYGSHKIFVYHTSKLNTRFSILSVLYTMRTFRCFFLQTLCVMKCDIYIGSLFCISLFNKRNQLKKKKVTWIWVDYSRFTDTY